MPAIESSLTILSMSGPFREPREQVFSYDYSIQRSTWPTPHGVRVKVSLPHELDVFKDSLLGRVMGSPGQQLVISNMLSKKIADWKIQIAEGEGFFLERRDVMLPRLWDRWGISFHNLKDGFKLNKLLSEKM